MIITPNQPRNDKTHSRFTQRTGVWRLRRSKTQFAGPCGRLGPFAPFGCYSFRTGTKRRLSMTPVALNLKVLASDMNVRAV